MSDLPQDKYTEKSGVAAATAVFFKLKGKKIPLTMEISGVDP
jgi:hypothetical protein